MGKTLQYRFPLLSFIALLYVGLSLTSYPFVAFKYFNHTVFQGLSALLLGFLVFSVILSPRLTLYYRPKFSRPSLINSALLFFLMFLIVLCVATIMTGSLNSLFSLLKTSIKYLISIMLLFFCPYIWLVRGLGVYSYFVMALSVGALGLFITQFAFSLEPIGYVDLDFVGKETEERAVYLTGLFWEKADVKLEYGSAFFRSQSFADEPGTFGFAILPAIFYFLCYKRFSFVLALILTLFSTMSLGAILALALVTLMSLFRTVFLGSVRMRYRIVASIAALAILGGALYQGARVLDNDLVRDYLLTKYDSEADEGVGSVGVRAVGLLSDYEYVTSNALGSGAGGRHAEDRLGLGDIGYFNSFIEVGYVGSAFYLIFLGLLVISCIRSAMLSNNSHLIMLSHIVLVLLIAGFQRSSIDATLWGCALLVLYVRGVDVCRPFGDTKHSFYEQRTWGSALEPSD